jgi:DNA primase
MDVIACHQAGVENAVAPLGTSLTADQCQILKRYAEGVTLLFDADDAGESAAMRGAELLLEFGILPSIVRLEQAKDADEYLRSHTPDDFEGQIARKMSAVGFRLESLLSRISQPPEIKKAMVIENLLPLLFKIGNEVAKSEMLKLISERLKVSLESLTAEWNKAKMKSLNQRKSKPQVQTESDRGLKNAQGDFKKTFLTAEEELLCAALLRPEFREKLYKAAEEDKNIFSDPSLLECLELMKSSPELSGAAETLSRLSAPASNALSAILLRYEKSSSSFEPEQVFDSLLRRIRQRSGEEKLRLLGMSAARSLNRGETATEDVVKFQKLLASVKGSQKE